ncbi:MAG: COX15/CtaA family protein [Myxococcales bacterium]|nr:COX15/CtaA family protein [Myxococcales bacterium]
MAVLRTAWMQTEANEPAAHDRAIACWLGCLFATLFALVLVGGITRLTGSGLSMVDWRPLMGVLPPIGEAQWREVFAAYKTSPQYLEVNQWMQLDDFKRIFFWEYFHRLMGRTIGLVAFVPWLYFSLGKRLASWLSFRVVVAIALGGVQGLLGWYMVRSGLVDRPEVSHLRLAAHLLLAFFIAQWILWTLLDLRWGRVPMTSALTNIPVLGLLSMVAVQILYGAFMAGTRAGVLFPTFPDMNGLYAPGPFFPHASLTQNLLYSPVAIHYIHRAIGFALLAYATGLLFAQRRSQLSPNWVQYQFGLVLLLQFVLGAATALYRAPLPFAIAHQAGAFALACSATLLAHRTVATRSGYSL